MNSVLRKIGLSLGFVLAFYIWFQTLYCVMVEHSLFPYESLHDFFSHFVRNYIMFYLLFICNYLIIFRTWHFKGYTSKRLIKDFILSNAVCVISDFLYVEFTDLITGSRPFVDWGATILLNMTMMGILETGYYIISYKRSLKEIELKNSQMLQYQYDALKAQVNPHFLFNSLSILHSLIDVDKDKSMRFTMKLSQTYRYVLSQQGRNEVGLLDEVKFLRTFADILEIRYNKGFSIEIEGEENIGEHTVIPYCLQLLLENVVKHNVINEQNPMCVKVEFDMEGVTMRNPVRLRQTLNSSKIGLTYIEKMYAVHGQRFEYRNKDGMFIAKIPYLK